LQTARERIGELERKVGQQELELDFFAAALRRIRAAKHAEPEKRVIAAMTPIPFAGDGGS